MNNKSTYVASRATLERAEMWRDARSRGWNIISTWIDEAGEGETGSFTELWARIGAEIAICDRLIFFATTEDFPLKGALVEVGMALALNRPVLCVLPGVALEGRTYRPVGSWLEHRLVSRHPNLYSALDS
jgi:hypothetical protein